MFPSSPAALNLAAISRTIDADFVRYQVKGGLQFFFRQLLEVYGE
jgi:hypothetical protein